MKPSRGGCLQDDHTALYCPKNPDRQWFGWFPNSSSPWQPTSPWQPATPWQPQLSAAVLSPLQSSSGQEICRRFNDGRCKQGKCRFLHLCKECHAPHAWVTCPAITMLTVCSEAVPPPTPTPRADRAAKPWPTSLVLTQRLCTCV